jgi:DNA-binding MarR family transcriptional regulator
MGLTGKLTRGEGPARAEPEAPLLSYLVGRLDRAIRNRLSEVLAPFALSVPQFTTLSVLKRRPGLSNAQLARRALILPQSMIQVIINLEERGLVQRSPDPNHNRILQTHLTALGERLLEGAEQATRKLETQLIDAVGDDDEVERIAAVLQQWANLLNRPAGATAPSVAGSQAD